MEKAELVCKVTPTNKSISSAFEGWYYNAGSSQPLSGEKYSISAGRLGISNPMRNYSGTYSARYILKSGSNELFYDCQVDFKAAPLILTLPRSQNLMLGQDINITCIVISYPKSVVHWTVDDKELPLADHRYKLSELDGHKNSKLSISSVRYADKGKYNCTAVNGLGNSSTKSILLRVKDPFEWIYPLIGIVSQSMIVSVIIIICARRERRLLEGINPKKK
ncbi:Neural cell adhesion molecule 1 [Bulinus truncatus]|nr:Neural cell adhesion molecule 1 [Bulinus truncatus]